MLYAVVLAAGIGRRMKINGKKQFLKLKNKPVINFSVDKFLSIKSIDRIIVVINEEDKNSNDIKTFITKYKKYINEDKIYMILGGKERYDSVYSALDFIDYTFGINKNDNILIHDSARPNFNIIDAKKLINYLKEYKAITLASKLSDTIKKVKNSKLDTKQVIKTFGRKDVYTIKTPQAFNLLAIYNAYEKFYKSRNKSNITDDIMIIEKFSKIQPYIMESSSLNIKITTIEDLKILKSIIK